METPCWCLSEGDQHGGRKVTETSVIELWYRNQKFLLQAPHIKNSYSSSGRTVQSAKTWAITPLLTYATALIPGSHVNVTQRINLEIQNVLYDKLRSRVNVIKHQVLTGPCMWKKPNLVIFNFWKWSCHMRTGTFPSFHTENWGLWKMYSLRQTFEGQGFPLLTNRSRVWSGNHLYH